MTIYSFFFERWQNLFWIVWKFIHELLTNVEIQKILKQCCETTKEMKELELEESESSEEVKEEHEETLTKDDYVNLRFFPQYFCFYVQKETWDFENTKVKRNHKIFKNIILVYENIFCLISHK